MNAHVAEAVREVVCARLLPAWLLRLDGDIVELLHRIDVENCAETALDMLNAIFKGALPEELQQNRVQLDSRSANNKPLGFQFSLVKSWNERLEVVGCFVPPPNRRMIPVESLSCEAVLYWRALCEFIKAKGDDGDELLEQVLPDAATYADYLHG